MTFPYLAIVYRYTRRFTHPILDPVQSYASFVGAVWSVVECLEADARFGSENGKFVAQQGIILKTVNSHVLTKHPNL